MFTEETFKKALPKQWSKKVNTELMDSINQSIGDPDVREQAIENMLSYTSVLKDGKFKMESYIDAVKYVTYKSMGDSNIQSWTKVFPARYARLVANNKSEKDISAHVAMYNGTALVNKILEQTLIPVHIMNAHHLQAAINTQVRLMVGAQSEKVQQDAANSLLTHLKPPETKKIELDVMVKDTSITDELQVLTANLAAQHLSMLKSGTMTAKDVAHQKVVIEGEAVDVTEED
jgi:hypothetical protein